MEYSKNNDIYIKKLHQDILIIMDEVDRICKEYNIRYYLMCGSCLGAVRHKGFIPWDDDLDIAMPRKDFERFISITSKNKDGLNDVLGDSLYLRWVTTEKYYNRAFAKVCLKGTVFQENEGPASQNAGIFVDVFPLDSCGEYNEKMEKRNKWAKKLGYLLSYKGADYSKEIGVKFWALEMLASFFSNRSIYKMMMRLINSLDESNTYYQAFYATPYPIKKMVFPKVWHGEGKRLLFEGRYYTCPAEAEIYLSQIYGKDYMLLPPENKRKTHYPIRVVFSDGEELVFEKAQQRVKYSDLLD